MTILEIVSIHLTENGFDGLYNALCDCACKLGDLAPCQGFQDDCTPGYLIPDFEGSGDWGMGPGKLDSTP